MFVCGGTVCVIILDNIIFFCGLKSSLCACEAKWNLTTSQFLSKYRERGGKEEGQTDREGECVSNAVLTNPSVFSLPPDLSSSLHLLLHLWLSSILAFTHHPSICLKRTTPYSLISHPLNSSSCFLSLCRHVSSSQNAPFSQSSCLSPLCYLS